MIKIEITRGSKKTLIFNCTLWILLTFAVAIVYAQTVTYITPNQKTVEWDLDPDNVAMGAYYELYRLPDTGDKADQTQWQLAGTIDAPPYTYSFDTEGKYICGLRACRDVDGEKFCSDVNWSDVNGEHTPDPFIIHFVITPKIPKGFRVQ